MIAHDDKLTEARRQLLQVESDSRRSARERNRLGQFATPNGLAIEIAQYAATLLEGDTRQIVFADPAIGTGSFFSAALTVFGRDRIAGAVGIEIDPDFCRMAGDLWANAGLEIKCGDFTRIVATGLRSPNLILANPPYVRHHHLTSDEKQRLQALVHRMTGVDVNGLAGLYIYFVLLATAWMEDGGIAAWLIPSEFMDVNYGAALKQYLVDRVTLIRVHRFDPDDTQFADALVSSAVVVLRKTPPPPEHVVEFTFGGALNTTQAAEMISNRQLRESRKWTVYPKHAKNDRQVSAESNGPKLRDFFRIQRGIATGNNKFFVLDRAQAARRGFPAKYLRPILPSPRHLKRTVIDADDFGYPQLEEQLCVIDCDLNDAVLELRYPALWNYLQTAQSLGIREGYLVGKRSPWYRQEQREPSPFLCTYMGRGSAEKQPFRFIWNRSAAIATNLYLMLYPLNGLAALVRHDPACAAEIFELLGRISGDELRGEGRVYGGGLHKIEPAELGRVSAAPLITRWPVLSDSLHRNETLELFS